MIAGIQPIMLLDWCCPCDGGALRVRSIFSSPAASLAIASVSTQEPVVVTSMLGMYGSRVSSVCQGYISSISGPFLSEDSISLAPGRSVVAALAGVDEFLPFAGLIVVVVVGAFFTGSGSGSESSGLLSATVVVVVLGGLVVVVVVDSFFVSPGGTFKALESCAIARFTPMIIRGDRVNKSNKHKVTNPFRNETALYKVLPAGLAFLARRFSNLNGVCIIPKTTFKMKVNLNS